MSHKNKMATQYNKGCDKNKMLWLIVLISEPNIVVTIQLLNFHSLVVVFWTLKVQ